MDENSLSHTKWEYKYHEGKSTLMIFERHANLKYKYSNSILV